MWESQELLSAILFRLEAGFTSDAGPWGAWPRWTILPLSGGSWEQSRQLDRVSGSGIISYCFLILDCLEENYGCFMSFLYKFLKLFLAVLGLPRCRGLSPVAVSGAALLWRCPGFLS